MKKSRRRILEKKISKQKFLLNIIRIPMNRTSRPINWNQLSMIRTIKDWLLQRTLSLAQSRRLNNGRRLYPTPVDPAPRIIFLAAMAVYPAAPHPPAQYSPNIPQPQVRSTSHLQTWTQAALDRTEAPSGCLGVFILGRDSVLVPNLKQVPEKVLEPHRQFSTIWRRRNSSHQSRRRQSPCLQDVQHKCLCNI